MKIPPEENTIKGLIRNMPRIGIWRTTEKMPRNVTDRIMQKNIIETTAMKYRKGNEKITIPKRIPIDAGNGERRIPRRRKHTTVNDIYGERRKS